MKKYGAELIGTFTLVLFGCGTAVVAGPQVGLAGISFAFGLALVAMAYTIGPVSGCHINPAVSLGALVAGRITPKDFIGYVIAQCLGAIAAAAVLVTIAEGKITDNLTRVTGLGQNGWGVGYSCGYDLGAAIVFELVATFLFVVIVLGATQEGAPSQMAGLAIGLALVAIHLFGIPVTGVSVNPARSLGPALLVGGKALAQLWLFLIIPSIGGALAGMLFRLKALETVNQPSS